MDIYGPIGTTYKIRPVGFLSEEFGLASMDHSCCMHVLQATEDLGVRKWWKMLGMEIFISNVYAVSYYLHYFYHLILFKFGCLSCLVKFIHVAITTCDA